MPSVLTSRLASPPIFLSLLSLSFTPSLDVPAFSRFHFFTLWHSVEMNFQSKICSSVTYANWTRFLSNTSWVALKGLCDGVWNKFVEHKKRHRTFSLPVCDVMYVHYVSTARISIIISHRWAINHFGLLIFQFVFGHKIMFFAKRNCKE